MNQQPIKIPCQRVFSFNELNQQMITCQEGATKILILNNPTSSFLVMFCEGHYQEQWEIVQKGLREQTAAAS